MKSLINVVGIVLVIGGIAVLAYQGFSYTKHETVAQIGNLQVTADTQQKVYLPPIVGGVALVAGIALLVVGRGRK